MNALLDVEDIIPGRFHLEVSSPGFSRPIRKEKDFEKYKGSEVKIKTVDKIDGEKLDLVFFPSQESYSFCVKTPNICSPIITKVLLLL